MPVGWRDDDGIATSPARREADPVCDVETEITPEIIEAGVAVLDNRLGPSAEVGLLQPERPDVAREIFAAICKAATLKTIDR